MLYYENSINTNMKANEDINKTIKKDEYEKIIFWVGSGVSYEKPTCFPLGNSLTKLALEDGLDKDCESFIDNYKKVAKILDLPLKECPRLETIFQIYKDIDENYNTNYLSKLKIFGEAEPNINHYLLANAINNGCFVFTSNFDNYIEKAYKNLFNKELTEDNIHHFHGTFDNIGSIGISIDNIYKIDSETEKVLIEILNKRYLHIFIGYSLSDDLDINNYLFNNKSESDAIFINHTNQDEIKELEASKRKLLENCFKNVEEKSINTTKLLDDNFGPINKNIIHKNAYNFVDNYKKHIARKRINNNIFKVYLSEYIGTIPDKIFPFFPFLSKYTRKYTKHIFFKTKISTINLIECVNEFKEKETIKSYDINRLSWGIYINYCEGLYVENNNIEHLDWLLEEIDKKLDYDGLLFGEKNTLLRNKGILRTILRFDDKENYINKAKERYRNISNVDGVVGCMVDLYLCDLIRNKINKNDINKNESNKLKELLEMNVLLPKYKQHYEYFKKKLASCK